MLIKILDRYTTDGKVFYEWTLHDGPDGIEEVRGFASDLVVAFSKIIEWRERIAADYAAEILSDMENAKQFIQTNDETD